MGPPAGDAHSSIGRAADEICGCGFDSRWDDIIATMALEPTDLS